MRRLEGRIPRNRSTSLPTHPMNDRGVDSPRLTPPAPARFRKLGRICGIRRAVFVLAVAAALTSVAQRSVAAPFNQVIVFGDSNVDSGYYKALSNPGGNATYNSLWPSAVAHGAGAPTTNPGPVNSQVLAAFFGLTAYPANISGGTNYATSGTKNVTINNTQTGGFTAAIPTVTQISNYLTANSNSANGQALYLIHSGDNDAKYAAGETGTGPYPSNPTAYMTQAADQLATAVQSLYGAGARHILVTGLEYSFGDTTTLKTLKSVYTQELWNQLATLGVPFIRGDVNSVRLAITANPSRYGFTTVSNSNPACTQPTGVPNAWALLCSSDPAAPSTLISPTAPQTNLFADDQHLGTAGQQLMGNYLARLAVALTATHDFNNDGLSDILWRDTGGDIAAWIMNGATVAQSAGLGSVPGTFSIIGQHDFDGDGKADVLWRDTSGNISMWFMNGAAVASETAVGNLPSNWTLYGTGDLNGDGMGDLLWRDSGTGNVAVWFMNGATVSSTTSFGALPSTWTILGDGNGGILWRDSAGDIALWRVQAGQVTGSSALGNVTSNFVVQGVGDFNGDGAIDILWRDTNSGALSIWFTNGAQVTSGAAVGALPSNWTIAQVGDYNGDGKTDILLLDNAGDVAVWLMNGAAVASSLPIGNVGTTWQVQNTNAN